MDESNEAFLLIGTFTILLIAFVVTVLAVMLIYRKRKVQHSKEIEEINERFERELLQSQLEVQRQTMQHIGREIHDNVGHQLTLAYLYTHQLEPDQDKEGPDLPQEIAGILDQALKDLRNLSKNLIKGDVHQTANLSQLLAEECSKLQSVNFCKVNFTASAFDRETSMEVNSFVLRILQEFTQNSLKHAECGQIDVSLQLEGQQALLSACDDGKGFDLQQLPQERGIGLINMQKRAEIIGGAFTLASEPGKGTRMQLRFSVAEPRHN